MIEDKGCYQKKSNINYLVQGIIGSICLHIIYHISVELYELIIILILFFMVRNED